MVCVCVCVSGGRQGGGVLSTNLHPTPPQHFRRNARSIYIVSNTMNSYTVNDSYFLSSIPLWTFKHSSRKPVVL